MKNKLKFIADVYSGITVRESMDNLENGDLKLLKLSDLSKAKSSFNADTLTSINWKVTSNQQFLKHNSVVLFARGEPTAHIFKGDEADKVLVSHMFIVINVNTILINPNFLLWYLNHSNVAKQFYASNLKGANMLMIHTSTIKELPIVIPSLQEQADIIQRESHLLEERTILNRLIKLRHEYNHAFNNQVIANALANNNKSIQN